MTSDPALALQGAIVGALKGNTDAGNNVFDSVPPPQTMPRITVGSGQSVGALIGARADDCIYDGSESFVDVDVWSVNPGFPQVKTIAGQVRDLLDDVDLDLSAEGHTLELLTHQSTVFQRESDGLTSRARMLFRALTQAD